jgi:hypothetical protein
MIQLNQEEEGKEERKEEGKEERKEEGKEEFTINKMNNQYYLKYYPKNHIIHYKKGIEFAKSYLLFYYNIDYDNNSSYINIYYSVGLGLCYAYLLFHEEKYISIYERFYLYEREGCIEYDMAHLKNIKDETLTKIFENLPTMKKLLSSFDQNNKFNEWLGLDYNYYKDSNYLLDDGFFYRYQ